MREYLTANLALWNEWTGIHETSDYYNLATFKAGKIALTSLEINEVGDVRGKSLLHLQCHFGLGSLSWARLGAAVTGVDFSEKAISLAKSLSQETGIAASFICSTVEDLPGALCGTFDIVFTSFGAIYWLPDLQGWAQVISHFLKPDGCFYIAEIHPIALIFSNEQKEEELDIHYPYFAAQEPRRISTHGSYVDRNAHVSQPHFYNWSHSLGDVCSALLAAGLQLQFLHEFPYSVYQMFPSMVQEGDWWKLTTHQECIPLTFSLKAIKSDKL